MAKKIDVLNREVRINKAENNDYICLTDIARYKNENGSDDLVRNWLRNRNTIEFLGLWEKLNNPHFNSVEFDGIKSQAGLNSYALTPKQWIEKTGAIGIRASAGRYGGTYAHTDIAFEFASWVSVEFKLYLIKEFERYKEIEQTNTDWDIRRNLTKINYRIQTDAIKTYLIPSKLTKSQISYKYASEADVLNVALFGKTAAQWRTENPDLQGNIRDQATAAQLVCLANLESFNAQFIQEGVSQNERISRLNKIAISQMKILNEDNRPTKLLGGTILPDEDNEQ